MPALVLMKAFENVPARYDAAMDLLTLGRIGKLKQEIAAQVKGGKRQVLHVLDVGCGTGSLAIMMAKNGAQVVGIDTSEPMLEIARQRVAAENLDSRVELRGLSAMEIDTLPPGSFDFVVTTLALSELSDDELRFVLAEAHRLLAPGGQLLVADEAVPAGRLRRLGFALLRFPLRLLTYLVTQAQSLSPKRRATTVLYFAVELPLMLLVFFFVPPSSHPLRKIERRLEAAGFRVRRVRDYLGGTLKLVHAGAA
jgi:demethylmenaquinone methyltransferase/2-methoxy-6-polyprenyl-1,4-benzoquinol methylase